MSYELIDESTLETLEEVTDALAAFNYANSEVGHAHQNRGLSAWTQPKGLLR